MSLKVIVPFITASAAVIAFFFMMGGEEKKAVPKTSSLNSEGTSTTTQPSLNPTSTSEAVKQSDSPDPAPTQISSLPTAKPQILEHIHEASVSYSADELPKIQPFLTHPDPEIRAAAVQGVIDLGDAAGGPILRKAAEVAPSQAEADAMKKAADYVELPSASLLKKK
jgi:hypothetical protein